MEYLETNVKKYKREIERLENQNSTLSKKVKEIEKPGISKQLEEGKLRSDYENLKRFVDSLPDEIKRQVRSQHRAPEISR